MRNALFILARLTDGDIEFLLAQGKNTLLPPGARLVTQGVPGEFLDIIVDGSFEVRSGANESTVLRRLFRGEIVGEVSFLDQRPPSASVLAVEPSRVLRVPKARVQARLDTDSAFAARFYQALGTMLAFRVRDLTEKQSHASSGDEDALDLDMLESLDLAARRFEQHIARRLG